MIMTNTEYMSDTARVERVVQKLMNMTVRELNNKNTKNCMNYIMSDLISKECLSSEKAKNMSYLELVCLVDNAGGNSKYDWYDHDSLSEQQVYYKCLAGILMEGAKVSIPVKMFMSLPLAAFYAHLHRASGEKVSYLMAELEHVKDHCKYKEGYTVRDFLTEKMEAIRKSWIPVIPLEEYSENIEAAHSDIGTLLVDSFRMAFPQKFCVKAICDKYRDPSIAKEDLDIFDMTGNEEPMKKPADKSET